MTTVSHPARPRRTGRHGPRSTPGSILAGVVVALLWALGAACGPAPVDGDGGTGEARSGAASGGDRTGSEEETAGRLGDGFVVWESNRTGDWRIWIAGLDRSGLRQLTADEPGLQHCCPHIAPDGSRLVYLSREAPRDRYPEEGRPGELRLLSLGQEEIGSPRSGRALTGDARTYGRGNRAAVWRSEDELIHVGADGRAVLRDLRGSEDGTARPLTPATEERSGLGWLVDATLGHATTGVATFSVYDPEAERVLERRDLGGCEPYFSHDGRWGFWVPGAGGPIDRIDLASREVSTILDKNDPRLDGKGYLYFAMFSRDGRLMAFGASDGEHSHFEADYDIYVAPTDPERLELLGPPVRITDDPATDRYPDVFLARPPPDSAASPWARRPEPERTATRGSEAPELDEAGWPVRRDDLVFLWQTGDSPNLVDLGDDSETGGRRAYSLEPEGRARLDHAYRMVLDHGAYAAPREAAERLLETAVASNEITVEATVVAQEASFAADGALRHIVSFASGPDRYNLILGQRGSDLVARIDTGTRGVQEVELFGLDPGRPTHVALTYSPGRLVAYRDGEPVLESDAITGSFTFHWTLRALRFGRAASGGGDWHGLLEGVALHSRDLGPGAIRESAARYRSILEERPAVPRWRVRARLRTTSEIPTLSQISPYRRALAVYEYRLQGEAEPVGAAEGVGSAPVPSGTVRVARWVLLDGTVQPEASLAPGSGQILLLEPFDANPQLGDVYLSDTLPPADGPLYYSLEP